MGHRDTKEKQIGDSTYRVTPLDGDIGRHVQLILLRAIAASVSSGRGIDLGALWKNAAGFRIDPHAALAALPMADFDYVCDSFALSTKVLVSDGDNSPKPATLKNVFKDHMSGSRSLDLWPWLAFAVEVNFGQGFFSEALASVRKAQEASKSNSPPAPIGSSGASSSPSV